MSKEIELLRWALTYGGLGIYRAGWGLHGEDGQDWHCHGCRAYKTTKGLSSELPPHKDFPHERNCKYVAAMQAVNGQS